MNRFEKIDRGIYIAERFVAGWISLGMAAIVFFDVVHRVFSRSPGRISSLLGTWLEKDPLVFEPVFSPCIILLSIWALAFGALKTRGSEKVFLKSILATAALTGIVQAFLIFVPQGLVWSPYLGLSALLWIGLLGASMATHQGSHLSMELGEKLWPKKALRAVRGVNGIIVGVFCAFLAVLAVASLLDHYKDWTSGPEAGLIPAIEWPKWVVFTVIPYAFSVMAFRFCSQALGLIKKPENKS